jgi:DNA-binding response OmpR family regulator
MVPKGSLPKRVLLVEDDPLDVNLIRRALSRTGNNFELRVLEDGEQGISFVRQYTSDSWTPELVLLDLNLPRRLGAEVLAVLKSHPKLRLVPVVVLTSSEAQSDVVNAYDQGASSYVRKPFSLDSIDDLVKTLQHYWFDLVILPSRIDCA